MHNLGLDELSHWLRIDEQFGYAVLFALIFLTTFRKSSYISPYFSVVTHQGYPAPLPLYSVSIFIYHVSCLLMNL